MSLQVNERPQETEGGRAGRLAGTLSPLPSFVSSPILPIDPDNRVRFELMGLERVRIALVRGFDIPRGTNARGRFGLG